MSLFADENQENERMLTGIVIAGMLIDSALFFWALGTFQPVDKWGIFRASLIVSVPIWGFAIWSVWSFFPSYIRASKEVIITFFLSIPVFLAAGFITMITMNGVMDISQPQTYEVQVVDKFRERTKNGYSYFLTVPSWREGLGPYHFHVGCGIYDRAMIGQPCTLTTRRGTFGFEWVKANSCR